MKKFFLIMAATLTFAACGPEQAKVPAIDLTNFDTSVSPAVDFYQYATGGWQKKNPLRPEFARFGTFDQRMRRRHGTLRVPSSGGPS